MTAIFADLLISVTDDIPVVDEDAGTVSTGSQAQTYCFRGYAGIYLPTNQFPAATGIVQAIDDQGSQLPYTPVKELIRAGIIQPLIVIVDDSSSGALKTYRKLLYHSPNKLPSAVLEAITADGVTWPSGKGKGQPITGGVNPVRVKSRS